MATVRTIEIHENITAHNDSIAQMIRERLKENKTLFINVMSGPGSGKTTTLSRLINLLKNDYAIGEMDVDIQSDLDARKVADATGVTTLQINNGGLCHIDADMTYRALVDYGYENLDVLFLENIGNMVCPAEFDTGAHINIMLLSIPEGDDKPLKYPLMFRQSHLILINKIDTMDYFDFDMNKFKEHINTLNPNAFVLPISAKTGEGFDELVEWIKKEYQAL